MIVVSFIYPDHDQANFDESYYKDRHIPRVLELWRPLGLQEVSPYVRESNDESSGPFRAMSMLTFDSREAYDRALENGGEELIGDIKNFTDIQPIAQISKPLS